MGKKISTKTEPPPYPNRQGMRPQFQQAEKGEPVLGANQGDSGKTPNINHAKGLPIGNNVRPPFKSKLIFDD